MPARLAFLGPRLPASAALPRDQASPDVWPSVLSQPFRMKVLAKEPRSRRSAAAFHCGLFFELLNMGGLQR